MINTNLAKPCVISICASLLWAASPMAAAQQGTFERERGSVLLGVFISDRDTEARLDSDSGTGTEVDLENDLGLDSSMSVLRLGGDYWFKPRQRVDVSVFDFSRTSSRRIDKTIEFGDQVFDIDTVVFSESDLTILKADYTYAVVSRPKGYFGVTGGLYVADTKISLSQETLGTAETGDLTAPLPVFGIRGDYEITERITLMGAAQWFGIDTGDVSGRLLDGYIGADYRVAARSAIGLAFNQVSMNIEAEKSGGFRGTLDWGYGGWLAYFKYDFGP